MFLPHPPVVFVRWIEVDVSVLDGLLARRRFVHGRVLGAGHHRTVDARRFSVGDGLGKLPLGVLLTSDISLALLLEAV